MTPEPNRAARLSLEAHDLMAQALARLGLRGDPAAGGYRLARGGPAFRAFVTEFEEAPHASMAIVAVEARRGPDDPGPISVLQMGVGKDALSAVSDGLRQWLAGVLPPILEALAPENALPGCDRLEMATVDRATGETVPWELIAGPMQFLYDTEGLLAAGFRKNPLFTRLIGPFAQAAAAGPLKPPRLAWLKAFLFREEDGEVFGECLLNNEPWNEGMAALQRFPFPPGNRRMGFKQFFMMLPGRPEKPAQP